MEPFTDCPNNSNGCSRPTSCLRCLQYPMSTSALGPSFQEPLLPSLFFPNHCDTWYGRTILFSGSWCFPWKFYGSGTDIHHHFYLSDSLYSLTFLQYVGSNSPIFYFSNFEIAHVTLCCEMVYVSCVTTTKTHVLRILNWFVCWCQENVNLYYYC